MGNGRQHRGICRAFGRDVLGSKAILVGALVELGKSIVGRFGEVRKAKHERKLKEITGEIELAKARIYDMASSWKDELLVGLFSFPFVVVFWFALSGDDEGIERVKHAFAVMSELPDWYQWAFLGIVSAVFGLRGLDKFSK